MFRRSFRGGFGPAVLACALSSVAVAQTAAPSTLPTREQLDPAQRAPTPDARPAATPLFSQPASGACPFAGSGLKLTLSGVDVRGATALPADALAPAYATLIGREIDVAQACAIRDQIADIYFAAGYLARVEVPAQTIEGGRLAIEVIEARIAEVKVTGDAGPAQARVTRLMERLRGDAPFDMKLVQRQLLLASDIPGMKVKVTVRPSAAGRGAVGLDVVVSRDAADGVAVVQNLGSDTIGPWAYLARVDLNSLTPLGERTTFVLSASGDLDEQRVAQVIEEIRLGDDGLALRASVAVGDSNPGGALKPLRLDGDSFVTSIELNYPLIRERRRNLALAGGLETADQSTDFGATRLIEDEVRVAYARLEADRSDPRAGYALSGRLELRKGLGVFGASDRANALASRAGADPRAFVLRADLRSEAALSPRFSIAGAAMAQWADDPLLAYEEMSVGNYTIGRGYDPSLIFGDRGIASSAELRVAPFRVANATAASLFAFYDVAHVRKLGPAGGKRTVDSLGGGLRLRLSDRADLSLTYAHPLDDIAGADDRLLVNLVARLF